VYIYINIMDAGPAQQPTLLKQVQDWFRRRSGAGGDDVDMKIIQLEGSKGVVIDRLSVPVEFSQGREIKHLRSFIGGAGSRSARFISHCTYEGRPCIFKYETESQGQPSNRFKIDMRLARLGISPRIFFPNAEDIDSNKYDYAIYEEVRVLDESIIRDMSGAKTLQRLKDMIIILSEFREDGIGGLFWTDHTIQNMGINERNELVILDGVDDVGTVTWSRERALGYAEQIYKSRFSKIISKAGGGRKLKRKSKSKKSSRRRSKNASKKRTRRRRRR